MLEGKAPQVLHVYKVTHLVIRRTGESFHSERHVCRWRPTAKLQSTKVRLPSHFRVALLLNHTVALSMSQHLAWDRISSFFRHFMCRCIDFHYIESRPNPGYAWLSFSCGWEQEAPLQYIRAGSAVQPKMNVFVFQTRQELLSAIL